MNINWKILIIGLILAIILSKIIGFTGLILGSTAGIWWNFIGQVIGYILATIYVGYTVGGDYINGGIYGAFICVIGGIIGGILSIIIYSAVFGAFEVTIGSVIGLIPDAILYGIVGSIGGIIGTIIKILGSTKGEVVT